MLYDGPYFGAYRIDVTILAQRLFIRATKLLTDRFLQQIPGAEQGVPAPGVSGPGS